MKRNLLQKCGVLAVALVMVFTLLPTPAAAAGHFPDVPASHWAYAEIQQTVDQGLFQGQNDGTFGVGQAMTRGSFVTVLCRLFGWEMIFPAIPSFSDVAQNSWCYSAVETARANGAISGHLNTFQPGETLTREEMAVMLVRALGYETLAGLAQDLTLPFTDLTSNVGYISAAYQLGLMSGFDETTFSPDGPVTREQAAVVLSRLHNKYAARYPDAVSAVWEEGEFLAPEQMPEVLVLPGASVYSNALKSAATTAEDIERAHATGSKVLFRAEMTRMALPSSLAVAGKRKIEGFAQQLNDQARQGGYDGILLEAPAITEKQKESFVELLRVLRGKLSAEKLLYVLVDAPVWQGDSPVGYDYAALGELADCMILRVASYAEQINGFPVTPSDPLEEVYYALSMVTQQVAPDKLSLWLTTGGSAWTYNARSVKDAGVLSGAAISQMQAEGAQRYWSPRYRAAYLTLPGTNETSVVWYLDREAAENRLQLARFFGVTRVMLSDLSDLTFGEECISAALWG